LTLSRPNGMMPPREGRPLDRRGSRLSRRLLVVGAGAVGLALVRGCALPFSASCATARLNGYDVPMWEGEP
jgi:hypothetical protein